MKKNFKSLWWFESLKIFGKKEMRINEQTRYVPVLMSRTCCPDSTLEARGVHSLSCWRCWLLMAVGCLDLQISPSLEESHLLFSAGLVLIWWRVNSGETVLQRPGPLASVWDDHEIKFCPSPRTPLRLAEALLWLHCSATSSSTQSHPLSPTEMLIPKVLPS